MFGTRWRLFRLLGIPVSLDLSWLIVLVLLTLTLASLLPQLMAQYFPQAVGLYSASVYWSVAFATAILFFVCILLHEFGHALVARRQGMPIRGITLFLFGGVAEIGEEPTSAGREFRMAIAGPAVSLVLVGLFAILAWVGSQSDWAPIVVIMLGYLATINLLILAFNLVPAFPLDGGRVLRSILWALTGSLPRATQWASMAGQAFAWLLIAWGVAQFFTGNWVSGIWTGLIGLFLSNAAQSSYRQVLLRQALHGERVRRFMNPQPIVVPPSLDLRRWVEDYVYHYHRKTFPVASDGRIEGVIDTGVLSKIPAADWPFHTIGDVMTRDWRSRAISPDADALEAFAKMNGTGASRLLVIEGDQLVGMISLKDLLRFWNLKLELEGDG